MTTRTLAAEQARPLAARLDGGAIGAWTLGFATVAYLGLKGGGFDVVVRSQAGIGVWWIVLIGAALGVLPQRRVGRAGLAALGLLAAFAAWSALSALWSESPERTISETARVVTLLGVAVLALSTVRAQRVRPLVNGIFAAIVGVGVLACLSRLHPAWFGEPETAKFLGSHARLSYGLNYWNALAAFMAMGVPLGLAIAMSARTAAARAAALGAVPVIVLTGFFTVSRGGILALGIGLLVALAITPDRGRWLGKLGLAAAGAAILVKGALQRDELRDGVSTAVAHRQGDELLVIVLVVVAGIVLVHVAASLAAAGGLAPSLPVVRPAQRRLVWGAVGVAVLAAAATFVASGSLANRWQEFKSPAHRDRQRRPPPRHLQRRGPLQVLGQLGACLRDRSCRRHRCRELRELVGVARHPPRVRPQRPLAVWRDAGRARADRYHAAARPNRLGLRRRCARRPPPGRGRRPRFWPVPPPPAPPSSSRPASTGSGR